MSSYLGVEGGQHSPGRVQHRPRLRVLRRPFLYYRFTILQVDDFVGELTI